VNPAGALGLAALLAACGHSAPFATVPERGAGPVTPGDPARLTHNPLRVVNYASDGASIVFLRVDDPAVRYPPHHLPRSDAAEQCVALLPSTGGSATWQHCNRSAGRGDSVNHILEAALGPDGRLLYTEFTGAPGWGAAMPVRWQLDLRVLDTADHASSRTLLPLYRDRFGIAVVPPDSINWLTGLHWLGASRFVANGSHVKPDLHLELDVQAVVLGTLTADGATLRRLHAVDPGRAWTVAPGHLLMAVAPTLEVAVIDVQGDRVLRTGAVPESGTRALVAMGCSAATCWLVTRRHDTATWETWQVDPHTAAPVLRGTRAVTVEGRMLLSPASPDALVLGNDALFLVEGLLAP
jgi:hypothetical protein